MPPRAPVLAVLLATLGFFLASPAQAQALLLFDGFDALRPETHKVRDVVEITRSPLFDNAPFLKLRPGDKLVRAKLVIGPIEKPPSDPDRIGTYLCSKGNYYELWTQETGGKLLLSMDSAKACLLFDWDLTLENAQTLRAHLDHIYMKSISTAQYETISRSLRKAFPDLTVRPTYDFDIQPDQIVTIPGQSVAQFQGIAYVNALDCLVQYQVRLSPTICTVTGQVLAQGPPHIERWQFEPQDYSGVPNAPPPTPTSYEDVKRKKAQFDAMTKFRDIILNVTGPGYGSPQW